MSEIEICRKCAEYIYKACERMTEIAELFFTSLYIRSGVPKNNLYRQVDYSLSQSIEESAGEMSLI